MIPSPNSSKAHFISYISLFTALAMIFAYIEALLPINVGIPGAKLGIANLVIIFVLYSFGPKSAIAVNILRIIMTGLLFSSVFGMLFSLMGGLLSIIVMILLKKTGLFSVIGVSIAGGVMHNMGQLLTTAFLISNIRVFLYFPFLLFSGIVSGAIIGIVALVVLRRIPILSSKRESQIL